MKKKIAVLAISFSFLLAGFSLSAYAAPVVEGFMGVPWGASPEQVQTVMAERGFKQIWQEKGGTAWEVYEGQFTDKPAQLSFHFNGDNKFYFGTVTFLHVKGKDYYTLRACYTEYRNLLAAKYGSPKELTSFGNYPQSASYWYDLQTGSNPPGKVKIEILDCLVVLIEGGSRRYSQSVEIRYSVDETWLKLKTIKNINDI